MYNFDCPQTLFLNRNDDTFPLPFLVTTAGTLDYTPSASNLVDSDGDAIALTRGGYAFTIRKIRRVFIRMANIQTTYDNVFYVLLEEEDTE